VFVAFVRHVRNESSGAAVEPRLAAAPAASVASSALGAALRAAVGAALGTALGPALGPAPAAPAAKFKHAVTAI